MDKQKEVQEIKLAMSIAAAKALDYIKKFPHVDVDDVIKSTFRGVEAEGVAKIASVAAITRAIKYRKKHYSMTDKQIMQKVTDEMNEIIRNVMEDNPFPKAEF